MREALFFASALNARDVPSRKEKGKPGDFLQPTAPAGNFHERQARLGSRIHEIS